MTRFISTALLAFGFLAFNQSQAQETLFFDDFNGPFLNSIWSGSLPTNSFNGVPFTGPPSYEFQVLATNTVLRLTNVLWDERRGWSTATNFCATEFRYELRFNSVVQSDPYSAGYFLEMWVLNATNPSNYDMVTLAGGIFNSSHFKFFAVSTITPDNYSLGFTKLPTNTWYRLVIEGSRRGNIRGVWLMDAGEEICSYTFGHNTGAFASGFKIAISQSWISPKPPPGNVDVAIDSAWLTGTAAPKTVIDKVDDRTVRIGWTSLANRQYQVQCCSDLTTAVWSNFGELIQGSGPFDSMTDTVTNPIKFYRVINLP